MDEAEELNSLEPGSHLDQRTIWLENATSSLIFWGTDVRIEAGSLSALQATHLEKEVRYAMCELQNEIEKIYDGRSFREEEPSPPGHIAFFSPNTSSIPREDEVAASNLYPVTSGDESAAAEDPMATMSSLIIGLQENVRPIRMIHASINQEGPYWPLKRQIDEMFSQHIQRTGRTVSPPHKDSKSIVSGSFEGRH